MLKRIISFALSLTTGASVVAATSSFDTLKKTGEASKVTTVNNDYELVSTNSLGGYIAEMSENQQDMSISSENTELFSVNALDFDYETKLLSVISTQSSDCKIEVSFIDTATNETFINETYDVKSGKKVATEKVIEAAEFPEYYLIKAKLASDSGKELSQESICYKYTEDMQEILKADINDFESEQVVNFDESETTNFLVLSEDTVKAESNEEQNVLLSADYDNEVFVFDNVDETVSSLESGEFFYIQPNEEDIIAIAVDSIETDGEQAIVKGSGEKIDDMFDFIKFESAPEKMQTIVTAPPEENGVTYEGYEPGQEFVLPAGSEINFDYSPNVLLSADIQKSTTRSAIIEAGGASVSGSLTINTDINFYKKKKHIHFGVEITPVINFTVAYGVETGGEIQLEKLEKKMFDYDPTEKTEIPPIEIGHLKIGTSLPGVYFYITPEIVISISGSIYLDVESQCFTLGFEYDSKNGGFKNLSNFSAEPFKVTKLGIEGELSVKFCINTKFVALSKSLAYIEGTISVGPTLSFDMNSAELSELENTKYSVEVAQPGENVDSKHACKFCISGQLSTDWGVSIGATVLEKSTKRLEFTKPLLTKDIYISSTNPTKPFNLGKCENKQYKTVINVVDANGNPVKCAGIAVKGPSNAQMVTDSSSAKFYCMHDQEFIYSVYKDDALAAPTASGSFTIKNAPKTITVDIDSSKIAIQTGAAVTTAVTTKPTVTTTTTALIDSMIPEGCRIIETKQLGDHVGAALYEDGHLWIYGYGDMNTPSSFTNADKITEVEFEDMLIEEYDNKGNLIEENVKNPVITSIGDNVFNGCKNLKEIEIPDTIKSIGNYAFSKCTALEDFTLPTSLKTVGNYAFLECNELTKVEFPESVETIGSYVFYNCKNIKEVCIGKNVTSIGSSLFGGTPITKLTVPYVDKNITNIKNIGNGFLANPETLNTIIVTGGNEIPAYAFCGLYNLEKVVLSNTIESIGNNAFTGCCSLNSIEYIEENTTKLGLPDTIKSIGNYAFSECTALEDFTLPTSLKTVGDYAFYNCSSLTSIVIPDSVTSIKKFAFNNCKNITLVGKKGGYAETFAKENNIPFEEYVPDAVPKATIYGDANCDGKVDVADIILMKSYLIFSEKYSISQQGLVNTDVQGDGNGLNNNDVVVIQQYTLKLVDKLPI